MSVNAPPELEFRRKSSSLAFSAKAFGSVNRVIFGENARVWESFGECLQKWKGRDFTHPLAPSAREGELKSGDFVREGEYLCESAFAMEGESKISPSPCGRGWGGVFFKLFPLDSAFFNESRTCNESALIRFSIVDLFCFFKSLDLDVCFTSFAKQVSLVNPVDCHESLCDSRNDDSLESK